MRTAHSRITDTSRRPDGRRICLTVRSMKRGCGLLRVTAAFPIVFAAALGQRILGQTQTPTVPSRPGAANPPPKQPLVTKPVPAPDPFTLTTTGTGVIRGLVTAVETNRPIRGAQLLLMPATPERVNPALGRTVATDEQGRYEITNLPPGRYTVAASKTGYVTRSYGQRTRSDSAAQEIELRERQALDKIDVALPLGGVAVVTVTDSQGEPLAGVQVDLLKSRFVNGQRTLAPSGSRAET